MTDPTPPAATAPDAPTEARTPMTFSATRLSMWMNCNRKGGWVYIADYPEAQTDDQGFGVRTHKECERLKLTPGLLPDCTTDEGELAAELILFVQDIEVGVDHGRIEGEFTFVSPGGVAYRGAVDISKKGHVRDYKTTSDFRWMKSAEDLLYDPQAVLYAYRHLREFPDLEGVHLKWIYGRKKSKKYPSVEARDINCYMTRKHAELAFAALESYAREMQAAANAAPPDADPVETHKYVLTLAPNPNHCGAYRGCAHRDRCNLGFFGDHMSNATPGPQNVSLLDRFKALAGGGGAPAPAAPPRDTRAVVIPPGAGLVPAVDPIARLKAMNGDAPAPAPAAPPPAPAAPPPARVGTGTVPMAPAPLNPPPGPFADLAKQPVANGPGNPHPAAPAGAEGINPPRRGPGRPPGSKNKAKEQPVAQGAMAGAPPGVTEGAIGGPPPTVQAASAELAVHLNAPPPANQPPLVAGPAMIGVPAGVTVYPTAQAASAATGLPVPPPPAPPALLPAGPPVAPVAPSVPAAPTTIPASAKRVGLLLVGCMTTMPGVLQFDDVLAAARDMIGAAAYFGGYGYKTDGMMAEAVARILGAKDRIEVLAVDPRAPEAAKQLSFLRAISGHVVEAVR